MADDDVPDEPDREPAQEPKRPLTPQDIRALALQKEQDERKARVERIKVEHGEELGHIVQYLGVDDPELRALAVGFAVENIANQRHEFSQLSRDDIHRICEKSIGQADKEEEKRRQTPETEEVARQSGDQPDRDQRPGELARNETTKEEEPEHQRESDSSREVSDSKAERKAKLQESFGKFDKEQLDKARQKTFSRDHSGRGRE